MDTTPVRMRPERGWLMIRRTVFGLGAVLVLALAIGGFLGCQKADPVAGLKERVSTYWGLKQTKSWDEVYEKYLDPEARKKVAKEAFLKRRFLAFDILSYEISDVKEEGDKATVTVNNEANIPLKTPQGELTFIKKQVTTKDEWVRRDGNWYVILSE
jgi:hypothetical protein